MVRIILNMSGTETSLETDLFNALFFSTSPFS
jgi:hypothetical protein